MAGFQFGSARPFTLDLSGRDGEWGGDLFYNDTSNWGFLWQKMLDQLGVRRGTPYYEFLASYSPVAQRQFVNAQYQNPDLRVQQWLTGAVPGAEALFRNQPAQARGIDSRLAGRPRFLL